MSSAVVELQSKFLGPYLADPGSSPDDWGNDVKAFCILCHAAFEDFAEDLSLIVCENSLRKWNTPKREVDIVLLSLAAFYGANIGIEEKENLSQLPVNDMLRKELDEIRTKHRQAIDDNHGFSKKYLRNLMTPIGINIPDEPASDAALSKISSARGSFAHTYKKGSEFTEGKSKWGSNRKLMSPDDAREAAEDCLNICNELKTRAVKRGQLANQPRQYSKRVFLKWLLR